MLKGRLPTGLPRSGLSLGSFIPGINAGVTTSHLERRLAEEAIRHTSQTKQAAPAQEARTADRQKSAAPKPEDHE